MGQEKAVQSERLLSLDALRGFDMMWIISGEIIIHALAKASNDPVSMWMSNQLHHTPWNGFTFYDMIFPLFIFIAGISMPYSYGKKLEGKENEALRRSKRQAYLALVKRTFILIVCGMVVNKALQFNGYEQTRFASVLGRIAVSCFFAAIIFLNCGLRTQIVIFLTLLIGYWILMITVPVPGHGAGDLTKEGNLEGYVDRLFLPGKLHRVVYDPEGILSTIPAIGTAMLGVFTGQFLRKEFDSLNRFKKSLFIGGAGIVLLILGLLWNIVFPINKNMWTSSFVLFAGGWSLLFLFVFYLVIDVWGVKKWCMPFVWIGTNSILIYMAAHGIIDFQYTSTFLFGGMVQSLSEAWQEVWIGCGILLIQLVLVYFLYKKRWFLKV
ncbi:MAG: hypothetical protein H6Q17_2615 [Bacteroidetes bacterium]|jgi:predicted acyltransferase|nr:hypothetical protein [Bacteroidota bacterium]